MEKMDLNIYSFNFIRKRNDETKHFHIIETIFSFKKMMYPTMIALQFLSSKYNLFVSIKFETLTVN